MRVRSPQDLVGGIALILLSILAFSQIGELKFGTASRMGPGYFPTVLSALTGLMGLVIAGRSLALDGPDRERLHWRQALPILGAILAFGLAIRPLGLVIASALLFGIAALGSPDTKWRELLVVSAALILFAVGLFVLALGLPFPLWPRL
ncbi:tripartite tricarboxylate transporter TctB family protein [Niveispirillum sp. KHB5.9]|uniref:tripartite tricarboxylate transporter TctB family protein n=1 Tax=Niveispirillum sp. KHB5.9 TaxID=3400269 RepID=UPI003A86FFBA